MSRRDPTRDAGEAPTATTPANSETRPVTEPTTGPTSPALVALGEIKGSHALRGEVRVQWYGDGPENLARVPEVWLAEGEADAAPERYEVMRTGSGRAGEIRLALRGVSDRNAADALRGKTVLGDAASLLPLPEGEFYWHQLVGCQVVDQHGTPVGVVQELWETGAHDLLVVESPDGERHLLSTARELMPEVDVALGRIVVEILPGMLDAPIEGRG